MPTIAPDVDDTQNFSKWCVKNAFDILNLKSQKRQLGYSYLLFSLLAFLKEQQVYDITTLSVHALVCSQMSAFKSVDFHEIWYECYAIGGYLTEKQCVSKTQTNCLDDNRRLFYESPGTHKNTDNTQNTLVLKQEVYIRVPKTTKPM
jgi:hypothetical protein